MALKIRDIKEMEAFMEKFSHDEYIRLIGEGKIWGINLKNDIRTALFL